MPPPNPAPILRLLHIDNLRLVLERQALHAPNHCPTDGRVYRTIYDAQVQEARGDMVVPAGAGGVLHDYVPFYFGFLSPMLLKLKTGQVAGYTEGQRPLIYLVSNCDRIAGAQLTYVFTDGHGLAVYTEWFTDLAHLDRIDWDIVNERYWARSLGGDTDRQRRKQAEFLVREMCPWTSIEKIVVIDLDMQTRVQDVLDEFDAALRRPVEIRRDWYYW